MGARSCVPTALLIPLCIIATTGRAVQGQAKAGIDGQSPVQFTVRVENVSTASTLKLSSGGAIPIPLSPGAWAVHTGPNPFFSPGRVEPGVGLEGLAEAGMAMELAARVGEASGVTSAGVFDRPIATRAGPDGRIPEAASPILDPGFHYEFTIAARTGARLSFVMMIGESNDGLLATEADGIALFDANGRPASGNVTSQVYLWDAGTEVNEDPGVGPNQGMRQPAPHAGDPERRPVRPMSEAEFGDRWPPASRMVRVTLRPVARQAP